MCAGGAGGGVAHSAALAYVRESGGGNAEGLAVGRGEACTAASPYFGEGGYVRMVVTPERGLQ